MVVFYTEIEIKSFVGQDEYTDTLKNLRIKGINENLASGTEATFEP